MRELERLRKEIASDRLVLERLLEKLASLEVTAASDEATCALVALTLHQVYTAVENTLKRIASSFEGLPAGDRWHRDLLDEMGREGELRPRVLSPETAEELAAQLAGQLARRRAAERGPRARTRTARATGTRPRSVRRASRDAARRRDKLS